ncbi:hypothetical protein KTS45_16840 [Halomicroarcula limicola]|uniref:Uncharacterized protein n=1 Tax=Haloarcula limicola TaxID=1429915 RepID=A0A8J8C529_9EURY|nr:hypothetical protein [Halomicroarcula limicola]MBV0925872.1 hypothetical protein [Halomicroarcula limicola]
MNLPSRSDFREVRRGLPALAALLFAGALLFPMWHIHIEAVQYPETVLHLELYAYPHIAGDYTEVARLNHYIGFYYPDPVYWQPNYAPHPRAIDVPEWSAGPFAFVAASLLAVFVAVAPTVEKLKRGLTWQLVGSATVFGVMLADIQYRLYQSGHALDPDAPVMGVDGFTPPLWGRYEVANITSTSHFGTGGFMAGAAIALLVIAYYYRDTAVTVGELPGRVAGRGRAVRERVLGGDDSPETPPARSER